MSHFVNTFFDIFVKILYAIRTIIAKSRKLQGFLYTDSLHGAHFLTTEAGDAAFSLEFRLAIFVGGPRSSAPLSPVFTVRAH